MNFLAHLYLAGNDKDLIIGNFIADHVKGSGIISFPEAIRKGIKMHREIDTYTDSHPIVRQSINRLRPVYRKYAGVIVDMYFDHFLANDWKRYSSVELGEFAKSRYDILKSHLSVLPPRSQRVLHYMSTQNWLQEYSTFEGLQQAFSGMAHRTTFESKMENAVTDLKSGYGYFQDDFQNYFPELCTFVQRSYGSL